MNSLRVKTFVKSSSIGDNQKLKAQTKAPYTPAMSLSKSLFYACTICSGPLVPESYCVFCKKTALRKCTKCNHIQSISNHESCRHLLSFGNIIFHKHHHKKWKLWCFLCIWVSFVEMEFRSCIIESSLYYIQNFWID